MTGHATMNKSKVETETTKKNSAARTSKTMREKIRVNVCNLTKRNENGNEQACVAA